MDKINFVNKPNTDTPINDKNLNKMQDNIENAMKSEKTESSKDTYNCDYINALIETIDSMKISSLNHWINVPCAEGSGVRFILPIYNPKGTKPTLNLTSIRIFKNGTWTDVDVGNATIQSYCKTSMVIYVTQSVVTENIPILVSIIGSIICD